MIEVVSPFEQGTTAGRLLEKRGVSFEFEGEMAPDVALNPRVMANYPFSRLSGPANVLVMPGLQSANISAKLLSERVIGLALVAESRVAGDDDALAGAREIGEHAADPTSR